MVSRLATDKEVDFWRTEGWVLLDGIVGTDEIDAVLNDLHETFPDRRGASKRSGRRARTAQGKAEDA